ncbi:ribosomal protein S18-alanine N-acetyltransferase [Thalassotalea agarivorans]|uniref:[Ribosomal protein bS18]-alanine N-acetyltransferase n=1 Tax=Thalassotalea agarivorans TaxID=349064 RepID=A0A1I0AHZ5_THASX|nr:ribosomal protein S18-alanine N-acetyltransferase [Thalassotalea agarivorans]SES93830.1 [SSU ribosomal protein S18P]-alanine acetyltransferase [Thalassotalea agarivorans]
MLSFHPITPAELDEIMAIENQCHSHPWSENTMLSCIGGRYFGELAKREEHAVGFYIAEYIAGESTLMDICIAPASQGKGLGKSLLKQFEQQAELMGAQTLFLEVRASNTAALLMYINNGFVEVGRRTGYYPKEVGFEDAIVMQKVIE